MSEISDQAARKELLRRSGVLAVVTPRLIAGSQRSDGPSLDILVCLTDQGRIFGFCGKVELGTGVRTALAQMIAEELDVEAEAISMILGDTENSPDHGPTGASETIQVTGIQLRIAAAQARHRLMTLAANALDTDAKSLSADGGRIWSVDDVSRSITYAELLQNQRIQLAYDETSTTKAVADYRIVGKSTNRIDIPDKAFGRFTYVHDVAAEGMLHGRVIRPPYSGWDSGEFVGRCLVSVDDSSVAHIPGIVKIVVDGDFVGIVAEREENAVKAASALKITWKPWTYGDVSNLRDALLAGQSKSRRLVNEGDVETALATSTKRFDRTYVWPYQLHGSIGPSCAVADVRVDRITVWAAPQSPFQLRTDISILTGLPEESVRIVRVEAAGSYGRNCADDVAADAVLLSRAVGRPVRVQLSREQENLWDPKGPVQLMQVSGALGANGSLAAYDYQSRYPANAAPTLALLLTGKVDPTTPSIRDKGDRTARPQYDYNNLRVTIHDMLPVVRAGWLRGVAALPNVFAHESFIDELAEAAESDPLEFRLRHSTDKRAIELMKATAARARWEHRVGPNTRQGNAEVVYGRGIAQAQYMHGTWPGQPSAWSTWVAEVAVNRSTGQVNVTRLVVGQDTGLMINPAGVEHQIHGNVIQSTSRVLKELVTFNETGTPMTREWGTYPIISFPEVPPIELVLLDRQSEPPLGAGESASIPSAAAIANAVYDATGVRFYEMPLTPERVLEGLGRKVEEPPAKQRRKTFPIFAGSMVASLLGLVSFGALTFPTNPTIASIPRPDPSVYSRSTIAKGEHLTALGACAVCHTVPGGAALAGGLELRTPFGTILTTNITPDVETGIGGWSYPAFERAMRRGIHRDGSNLYPAFPYPSFAKTSDEDLLALYAYLMAQPAVSQVNKRSSLILPLQFRPLMAIWNVFFNRSAPTTEDTSRSAEWNRGRYLVDGLGHCGACHTPRNLLGAEKTGPTYLAGAVVDGWDAPALTDLSVSPIPWTEQSLYAYLRLGISPDHGVAAGPMAPIVQELKALPDGEIRAMAIYLASFNKPLPSTEVAALRASLIAATSHENDRSIGPVARLFDGACAVCHEPGRGPVLFNKGTALGLATSLHLDRPDNFLNVVLHGIKNTEHGTMPAFEAALDDSQIIELARYARRRFASDKPPWLNLESSIIRVRNQH